MGGRGRGGGETKFPTLNKPLDLCNSFQHSPCYLPIVEMSSGRGKGGGKLIVLGTNYHQTTPPRGALGSIPSFVVVVVVVGPWIKSGEVLISNLTL